ncbi:MAG TPA: efflux transporter periplasmic adaptor subunit, partial [Thermoanaerobaculia bacterium]|nr:efflux transporter periplasmic adaptor subunit [Thermoanaerobaculia bacterium]
ALDLEFVDRLPEGIKRGQTLHLRLMLGERAEALTLAAGPFFQKTGGRWAYVVEPGGSFATRRPIALGRRTTDAYEVLEGLAPGDRVITSSYDTLGEYERLVFGD